MKYYQNRYQDLTSIFQIEHLVYFFIDKKKFGIFDSESKEFIEK